MKILILDIETAPNTAHVWGLWNNDVSINQLLESSYVMCWSAKWYGEKKVMFSSVYETTQKKMLESIYKLLNEADVVCHYNGTKFDVPTLNKEFLLAGMTPPSPYRQIDVLNIVRRRFRFPSNKLDYVAQRMGLGKKFEHEGHALWIRCMSNDASAWRVMKKYNMRDVTLLEKVYDRLLPWITNHPNRALYDINCPAHSCPNCGSKNVHKRGIAVTSVSRYQRYRCNKCGAWSRGEKIETIKGLLRPNNN